jgi:DNA-binding LytR/AlgR family response regulator
MIKKTDQIISSLYDELGLLLSISFGIFLFILFFQPFPLNRFDFNNNLLFVAGFATIVFLVMFLVRIVAPWIIQNNYQSINDSVIPAYLSGFSMLALNSVAFAFYLRYVGLVSISFFVMLKVALICLSPSIILRIYDIINNLRLQNESLIFEKKIIQKQIEKYEEDYLNKSIDFISENNTETLNILVADVVLIKSADNYVEIVYKDGFNFSRKLIRNTLKNIEQQLRHYSNFIRCHRICIVNLHYIEKLNTSYNSHWITIKGYNEQIPVSRQYLLKLKEAI